ncbi:MAG: TIGR02281 family clan AA aspartic protease [Alphaproteobacteria bacterium]
MINNYNDLSGSQIANVIYIIIVIALIAFGFSRKEMPVKLILKYTIIWIAIILFVIVLYSFRYEFGDVKNRVSTELFPSKAVIKNHEQIIIAISADGHFYINLKVNNKNIRFMIDTGASETVIDKKIAKNIGIDFGNIYYDKIFKTANGQVRGASINIDEIDVSGMKFYNVEASITESDLSVPLLGMSFLKRFYKYEFYREKLILTL